MAKSKWKPRSDFTSNAVAGRPSDFETEQDDFIVKASPLLCREFLFHYTSAPSHLKTLGRVLTCSETTATYDRAAIMMTCKSSRYISTTGYVINT